MSVVKISSIDELIELSLQNLKNQTKLFRGQDKNYSTTPSASRQITLKNNPVDEKGFEKFIEEFKLINPSICHDKVARTFSKIFKEMYPSYSPWINKSETENELVQLLLQVLRQQYSRSALLLDVTKDLAFFLRMGQMSFCTRKDIIDGRYVLKAKNVILKMKRTCQFTLFHMKR